MHDQPAPTEQEEEQAPERLDEEQAQQYPGHEDPPEPADFDEEE
jgi:hypothetical protein